MTQERNQSLPPPEPTRRFGRKQPATYRIEVAGEVDPAWSDRLGGLRIEASARDASNEPVTVLEGLIRDQAQFLGILDSLYGLRCTLLWVERLNDEPPIVREADEPEEAP